MDHDATANSTLDRLLQPARASTVGPEVRFAILDGVDSTFTYLEKEFMEDVDAAAGDMESEAKRMDAAVRATTDVLRKKMRRQNRARVKTEKRLRLAKVGGGSWKVEGSDPWSSQQ